MQSRLVGTDGPAQRAIVPALAYRFEGVAEINLRAGPAQRTSISGEFVQRRIEGSESIGQCSIVAEIPALIVPAQPGINPIDATLFVVLNRVEVCCLLQKPCSFGETQPRRFHLRLLARQRRLLALLVGEHPRDSLALRVDQIARLLQLGAGKIVVWHALQRRDRRLAQRLHVRVANPETPDLLQQANVFLRDLGEAVGELAVLDRLLM